MESVRAEMWDPRPPSKHASPLPQPPPSYSRLAHVTTATPAKRITFFKSGDSQFGGIRMAVHKRSFKCFDALLDDLSQKVPLPFGVRTVTTPRGTHAIKHLEQLQDGGCYLCSDRRQAKPVNMEIAGKRQNMWYHHSHKPHRPESLSATPPGHIPYRQRRILLVKNSEPGMRRSVVLSRRSARSLRAFLDEVSEVMQFHVRKLYTAEGRRIDSVQSLMTCPGVLVCVGREAFSPMLVHFIRKSSEEKLPCLGTKSPSLGPRTPGNGARSPATQGGRSPPHGAQSRASQYSEGHESKKSVNFGLETKKSIIHPRSDSSARSARFSLSSEKSYSNGVSAYSQARPDISNEDIEKRVLVNKDGSLSVEMRVRFRLQNDETLQWSTQIKKSPSLTNECCPLSQAPPHYLQQAQSESCSDPDSTSFDPEGVEALQQVSGGSHCPCCYQRQEQQYDLWENPAHSHKHHPVPPQHTSRQTHTVMRQTHSSSSSSSGNSRRVVRCRARLSNCGGGSGSEQSQLVEEEMCVTEQVERRVKVEQDGDTCVEVCRVSRCCSRSEVVARKSFEDELMVDQGGERPLSAISSSSRVLQSLKEDQDDDLPPSASQCSHRNEPSPSQTSEIHQDDRPASNMSAGSRRSAEHTKQKDREEKGSRAVSAASSCHCGAATPHSTAGAEEMDRAASSRMSRASCRSSKAKIPTSEEEGAADDEDEEIKRVVSGLSGCTGLSGGSSAASMCHNCGGCKRGVNSVSSSRASQRSQQSTRASPKPDTPLFNQENATNGSDDDGSDGSAESTQSNKTNLTDHGRISAISNVQEGRASSAMSGASDLEAVGKEEERAPSAASAMSHKSNRSHKSGCSGIKQKEEERSPSAMSAKSHKSTCSGTGEGPDVKTREEAEGDNAVERAPSSLSAKSGASSKTNASVKLGIKAATPTDDAAVEEGDTDERAPSALSVKSCKSKRPDSAMSAKSAKSAKSNVSAKSGTSQRSSCSHCMKAFSPDPNAADEAVVETTGQEEVMEVEERAVSAMSAKSHLSAKSIKSNKSSKASERSLSPRSEPGGDLEKRATSQMSNRSVKSNTSAKSSKSCNETAASPSLRVAEEKENEENEERAASAASSKSHKSDCNEDAGAGSGSETGGNRGEGDENSSPAEEPTTTAAEDRTPSAMSGKSHTSARSSKSQKSNRTTASPSPNEADGPSAETNEGEQEHVERGASALSVKSTSSHKSNASKKSGPSNLNVVTINITEGADEDGNDTTERAPSAASVKSGKSCISPASSRRSNRNGAADADKEVAEDRAPSAKSSKHSHGQTLSPRRSKQTQSPKAPATPPSSPQSSGQQLLPGPAVGETRGPSALSVHSIKSSKSGKSKCSCGAASAKKEKEEEEKREDNEEASERAASILSSSTKRQRRESGGTEQPLSRNSSGSVSLGLPEDHDTADSDSGKSSVSFHVNAERKSQVKTPDVPKGNMEGRESAMSKKSNSKSALSHNLPAVDIPTIETPGEEGGEQKTVRAASAISSKSNRSRKSCCNCGVKAAAQTLDVNPKEQHARTSPTRAGTDLETGSVKSDSSTKASNKTSSAAAKVRSKSSASVKNANAAKTAAGDSGNNDSENQAVSRPASEAEEKEVGTDNKAKSISSIKTSTSQKKETAIKPSSTCLRPSSRACSDSTLSHSLSAADLLKEVLAATRPHSRHSNASNKSDKPRSEKSHRSRHQLDEEELRLTPACLPNASPNEVVSDWLRSIPADSSMLELGDELREEEEETAATAEEEKSGEEAAKEEDGPEGEKAEDEVEEVEAEEEKTTEEAEGDAAEEEKSSDPAPGDAEEAVPRPVLRDESLPRNWHSSAAVMKVLLSSSTGRCQSMPEVSPVYGRRLSTSARGFLDCLAQLQLIDPGCDQQKDRNQRYEEIMTILQSLWLTEPRDFNAKEAKEAGKDQVTPPRSSSGVDMSSGSGGSGKENGNLGGDETEQNKANEAGSLQEDEAVEKVGEEEEKAEAEPQEAETDLAEEQVQSEEQSAAVDSPKATENPSSSDKSSANDSSKSPTDNERETPEDSSSGTPPTVVRAALSKKSSQDPDPVWILHLLKKVEKQFMSHYIDAMAEFKVRWDLDDSLLLNTMMSELREEVSRRIQSSIEREMRKIQSRAGRQGRSPQPPRGRNLSRESTTTEKRRQMLRVMKKQSLKTADSLSDGEMTGDFSDQRSEDEYCPCDACVRKKMAARPLMTNPLAAEAPVMMEFDLLKILQLKKSPTPAVDPPTPAEEEEEKEGDTLFEDKEVRSLEVLQEEEEEDETKEDIRGAIVLEKTIPEEDEGDIEGEKEESSAGDEEQNEGESGGEEAGEEETSGNGEEEEEEEAQCQCQCAGVEEEEEGEGETAEGEDAEETSDNTGEDEAAGEEEGESAEDEGETGTGEDEEESDKETVREVTAGETTGNGEGEEEEEEAGEEECEVSDFKPEDEEETTTGKESGEEEPSGETEDDDSAKNTANEESPLVEESAEGNVSASAEAEDEEEEDEGTGEGESNEDAQGGESDQKEREASEEETASPQGVTEGEEADGEYSDTDCKRPSDTSADESGRGVTENEEEKESGVEEEGEGEVSKSKKDDCTLLHQFTRTSVESQPGSLEDVNTESPHRPVDSIEVPKMAADDVSSGGGAGQRRSRSPGRVKRRKPKESDVELDDI